MPVTPQGITAMEKNKIIVANIKKEIISSLHNGVEYDSATVLVNAYDRSLEYEVREAMWQLIAEKVIRLTDGLGLELNHCVSE